MADFTPLIDLDNLYKLRTSDDFYEATLDILNCRREIEIDYSEANQVNRKNLEKALLYLQKNNIIDSDYEFTPSFMAQYTFFEMLENLSSFFYYLRVIFFRYPVTSIIFISFIITIYYYYFTSSIIKKNFNINIHID